MYAQCLELSVFYTCHTRLYGPLVPCLAQPLIECADMDTVWVSVTRGSGFGATLTTSSRNPWEMDWA